MPAAEFDFDRIKAFGWLIHRKRLAAGECFDVEIPAAYPIEMAANISLWTRGYVTGVDKATGLPCGDRRPGHSVLERDVVPAGSFRFTAQEPSEFWCMSHRANALHMRHIGTSRLPRLAIVSVAAGGTIEMPRGARLLICVGRIRTADGAELAGPLAVALNNRVEVLSDLHGLHFKD